MRTDALPGCAYVCGVGSFIKLAAESIYYSQFHPGAEKLGVFKLANLHMCVLL